MPASSYRSGLAVGFAAAIVVALGGSSMETIATQQRMLPAKQKPANRVTHPQPSTGQFVFQPVSG
jgi:hypothetical protein